MASRTTWPRERPGLIEADGHKVGLVRWQHPERVDLEVAGLDAIPTSVIDIGIMIGERDAAGQGFGPQAMRRGAEAVLADPSLPCVIGCAEVGKLASQRAFVKAGFCRDRLFYEVPNGDGVLRVRQREGDG